MTKQTEKLQALESTMQKKGVEPNGEFYSILVSLYLFIFYLHFVTFYFDSMKSIHFCQEGKLLDAISILKKMREANMKLPQDTWRPLVSKLIKDGFKEDALKVVEIAELSGADVSFTRKYIDKL